MMCTNKIIIIGFITITLSLFAMESSPDSIPARPESTTPLADEEVDVIRSNSGSKGRRNAFDGLYEMRTPQSRRDEISRPISPLIARTTGRPFVLGNPRETVLKLREGNGRDRIEEERICELLELLSVMNKTPMNR